MTSAAFPIKKKVTEPQSVPFFPEEALIDSTMRARSPSRFLLLSLFVSWPLELQASNGRSNPWTSRLTKNSNQNPIAQLMGQNTRLPSTQTFGLS